MPEMAEKHQRSSSKSRHLLKGLENYNQSLTTLPYLNCEVLAEILVDGYRNFNSEFPKVKDIFLNIER